VKQRKDLWLRWLSQPIYSFAGFGARHLRRNSTYLASPVLRRGAIRFLALGQGNNRNGHQLPTTDEEGSKGFANALDEAGCTADNRAASIPYSVTASCRPPH
jgi:hypothetical protein